MPSKSTPPTRDNYPRFHKITTRWMDNDPYRHINNVIYYSFFDTAVNQMLIQEGFLDIEHSNHIGLVVESKCHYLSPLSFPDEIEAGVNVEHLGRSSVRYGIAIFQTGEDKPSAYGHFIHVYVDRHNKRPATIPSPMRSFLEALQHHPIRDNK